MYVKIIILIKEDDTNLNQSKSHVLSQIYEFNKVTQSHKINHLNNTSPNSHMLWHSKITICHYLVINDLKHIYMPK